MNKLNSQILKIFFCLLLCTSSILEALASPIERRDASNSQNPDNGSKITVHTTIVGIILIIVGIIYCFYGRKHYRLTMFLLGYYIGALITWIILTNFEPQHYRAVVSTIILIISLVVGLIVGLLTMCCADLAIWALGGLGGYAFALFLLAFADNGIIHSHAVRAIFIVIFVVAGVILMMFFKNTVIILATAFIGAYSIMLGIDMFARTGFKESVRSFMDGQHDVVYHATTEVYLMLAALFILFVLGTIYQWNYHRHGHFGYHKNESAAPSTTGDTNNRWNEWRRKFGRRS
ncbi:12261_t:CDS:2 [Ambispora leptoticha]|uniref:Transmembrane protein 198 n=1 Tax=Ambispora leptoticha TaxID=144679 RepID=A0A9N8VFP8_9GLOM|nr:12261_t:CDS:2 [Ambispora leptoticha]